MKARVRPLATGLGLALFTGSVMAAPIGGTEILLGLLAICWIGFPLLLLVALVWQLARSTIASVAVRLILSRPGKPATLPGITQTPSAASRAANAASSGIGQRGIR